jgi:hypothetical protein
MGILGGEEGRNGVGKPPHRRNGGAFAAEEKRGQIFEAPVTKYP